MLICASFPMYKLPTLGKFKACAMLAQSLKKQKELLSRARFFLSSGMPKNAKSTLDLWHKERLSYKALAKINNVTI